MKKASRNDKTFRALYDKIFLNPASRERIKKIMNSDKPENIDNAFEILYKKP